MRRASGPTPPHSAPATGELAGPQRATLGTRTPATVPVATRFQPARPPRWDDRDDKVRPPSCPLGTSPRQSLSPRDESVSVRRCFPPSLGVLGVVLVDRGTGMIRILIAVKPVQRIKEGTNTVLNRKLLRETREKLKNTIERENVRNLDQRDSVALFEQRTAASEVVQVVENYVNQLANTPRRLLLSGSIQVDSIRRCARLRSRRPCCQDRHGNRCRRRWYWCRSSCIGADRSDGSRYDIRCGVHWYRHLRVVGCCRYQRSACLAWWGRAGRGRRGNGSRRCPFGPSRPRRLDYQRSCSTWHRRVDAPAEQETPEKATRERMKIEGEVPANRAIGDQGWLRKPKHTPTDVLVTSRWQIAPSDYEEFDNASKERFAAVINHIRAPDSFRRRRL